MQELQEVFQVVYQQEEKAALLLEQVLVQEVQLEQHQNHQKVPLVPFN